MKTQPRNCSNCRFCTLLTNTTEVVLCINRHAEDYGEEVPVRHTCELHLYNAESTISHMEDYEKTSSGSAKMKSIC